MSSIMRQRSGLMAGRSWGAPVWIEVANTLIFRQDALALRRHRTPQPSTARGLVLWHIAAMCRADPELAEFADD
jgi:hypothetical protein